MHLWLYNFITKSYFLSIRIAALGGNVKAKLREKGIRDTWQVVREKVCYKRKRVWFHCASLGEFEQTRPVLERFREKYPDFQVILTFFSPSGYEVRKNYPQADLICYLPNDSQKNAQKFLEILQPNLIFWTKYDFWYHFLRTAKQKNIPVLLFSAIFRPEQLFFKPHGKLHRQMLTCFTHIFVQNENSLQLLKNLDVHSVSIAGDTRFDRVTQILQEKNFSYSEKILQFKNHTPTLIVGSAWQEDLAVIEKFYQNFQKPLKLIIAPHEIHENEILHLQQKYKALLFTDLAQENSCEKYKVLIVNTIGVLAYLYAYADFAFVGGAYKQGLHNILEPAVFGLPIFFGNKAFQKFQEAQDLLNLQTAWSVANENDFLQIFEKLYQDREFYNRCSHLTRKYVEANIGATQKIMLLAEKLLSC
ncbi:MAG: glycosyltransferase N-terminal domain-containing protein [Raineya sp.]|nr:3-deoxy-D-manno-octulosonic acid transferase [Raineya sp.]MDW8297052.1 glycosyltransferase N-terminal domain-containing protein [Raineya sp.]